MYSSHVLLYPYLYLPRPPPSIIPSQNQMKGQKEQYEVQMQLQGQQLKEYYSKQLYEAQFKVSIRVRVRGIKQSRLL